MKNTLNVNPMGMIAAAVLALGLTMSAHVNAQPVKLIIDTDFGPDCDDVGALAIAHHLMDVGEAEIIGVVTSTYGHPIVAAIDAVNHYYGRPDIPIGHVGEDGVDHGSQFTPYLADTDNFPSQQTNDSVPHSTQLYRELLHNAEEPVNIAVIGFQSAISHFLDSEADHDGDGIPYTGLELAEENVEKLVLMAANFDDPGHLEWNVEWDVPAAQNIANNWPGEIVYSGFAIGIGINSGEPLTDPNDNPVAMAYKMYDGAGGTGEIGDRHSWDLCAVFMAVLGTYYDGERFWELSDYGTVTINDQEPYTEFDAHEGGRHRYKTRTAKHPRDIGPVFDQWMTAPPAGASTDTPTASAGSDHMDSQADGEGS